MLKTGLLVVMIFGSFSAQAKVLVCGDLTVKYGFSTESTDLYVASVKTPDSEVVKKGNEHGRIGVTYDATADLFAASGEDGCIQVAMETQKVQDKILLIETDEYDVTSNTVYECREISGK